MATHWWDRAREAAGRSPVPVAQVLVRDVQGRVLLVLPTYKDEWILPGGIVDEGESPAAAAIRELQEETGLRRDTVTALVTEVVLVEGDPEKPLEVTVCSCSPLGETEDVVLPPAELRASALLPPEQALTRIAPYERDRLRRALLVGD